MKESEGSWRCPEGKADHNSSRQRLRVKIDRITRILEKEYGVPRKQRKADPLDVLIQTILSQNTNDRNRDRAYARLTDRFSRWEDVIEAELQEVVEAIRPGGLAEQKARRIQEMLRWIKGHHGELSLRFLRRMDSREILRTLGSLKGIGPKTLHCLLLFGLGREAFPVDTHVLRVGKRLGFIPERMGAEDAHGWMIPLVPEGKSLSLHINLIRLGRSVCEARTPHCLRCFLKKECLAFRGRP